jgi:type II secretory pathway pseudopilin PulG/uncharacterized protein (DUF2141 family)
MSGFYTQQRSDSGMSIAEVLIASSILLVCLIALAAVLGGVITQSAQARSRDEATNLANARLETARSLSYDSVGVHYADGRNGEPAGSILTPEQVGRFVVATDCEWVQAGSGRAAYKRIKVRVSWRNPVPGSVDVNTIIYGKSTLLGVGDFLVKLRSRESPDPVAGTEITLVAADGSAHRVTTNASGEALFGQVPVGACTLSLAPDAGYIVDAGTLANTSVSGDAVSTAIVYLQHPAQAIVQVTDMNGAALSGASVKVVRSDGAVNASSTTGVSGAVTFSQLLYGDYTATVSRAGYAAATLPFTVSVSAPSPTVTFRMSASAVHGVRVQVFDSNQTQLSGATVVMSTQAGVAVAQGVTGSNGEISFSTATWGNYTLTVDKTGYVSQTAPLYVHDNGVDEDLARFNLTAVQTMGNMHVLTTGKNNKLQSLRVVVSGPGGYFSNTLYSSSTGELWFNSLVPGSYSVQIYSDPGSAVTAIINAGQTADVSVSQRK